MLFRIGMAVVISLLAAIIAMIAGLMSGVRTGIVMLRAVLIFAVSGFGLTFGLFWLEKYGIPLYMAKRKDDEPSEWLKLYLSLKEMEEHGGSGNPEEQIENAEGNAEDSLLDVSVSDEMNLGSLTEEELASLNEEVEPENDELVEENEEVVGEENVEDNFAPEAEQEEIPEQMTGMDEPEQEFTPLSVENMTRMTVPPEVQ